MWSAAYFVMLRIPKWSSTPAWGVGNLRNCSMLLCIQEFKNTLYVGNLSGPIHAFVIKSVGKTTTFKGN